MMSRSFLKEHMVFAMYRVVATLIFLGSIHFMGFRSAVVVEGPNAESLVRQAKVEFPNRRIFVIGKSCDREVREVPAGGIVRSRLSCDFRKKWSGNTEDFAFGPTFAKIDRAFLIYDFIRLHRFRDVVVYSDAINNRRVGGEKQLRYALQSVAKEVTLGGAFNYTGLNLKK